MRTELWECLNCQATFEMEVLEETSSQRRVKPLDLRAYLAHEGEHNRNCRLIVWHIGAPGEERREGEG